MIKVINKRDDGRLYHYAHFICDCLFPEIINGFYKYDKVIRQKNLHQTIGNFYKIYEEVMMNKNIELNRTEYFKIPAELALYKGKKHYKNKIYFEIFRNFIFNRYNINPLIFDKNYPEVILIKRSDRKNLIDNIELKNMSINDKNAIYISTGKERREIDKIDMVEEYLKNKYNNIFKSIFLENISFEEQIKYFNNSKLIICAHGAAMSNMFFCKEGTKIIEVTCNTNWEFFDIISKILNLNHIKCYENKLDKIIQSIDINII
jgi:hypothetical protein